MPMPFGLGGHTYSPFEDPYESGNENMRRNKRRVKAEIKERKRSDRWKRAHNPFVFGQRPGFGINSHGMGSYMNPPVLGGFGMNQFPAMMPQRPAFSPMDFDYKRRIPQYRTPMSPLSRNTPFGFGRRDGPFAMPRFQPHYRGYPPNFRRSPYWEYEDGDDFDGLYGYSSLGTESSFASSRPRSGSFGSTRYDIPHFGGGFEASSYDDYDDVFDADYEEDELDELSRGSWGNSYYTGYGSRCF